MDWIFSTLSPEKKLLNAVTSSMLDAITELIQEFGTVLINTPLYRENRRTALHLACESENAAVVQLLVDAGGDVNALDLFGSSPLMLALRHGKANCAKVILQNSSWHPGSIWRGRDEHTGRPYWTDHSETILCLMVIGTPNVLVVENIGQFNFRFFLELCEKYAELTKAFYLTGNQLPAGQVLQFYSGNSTSLGQWIHRMLGIQTLQHYARIAVRRRLNTNVFYGVRLLPLPVTLQKFLIFEEEMPF